MIDVRGQGTTVGDSVAIATRKGNLAHFEFGTIEVIDPENRLFRLRRESGKISAWMNWYYHDSGRQEDCKVLKL